MITPIRHSKLNTDIAYLHSKSDQNKGCEYKTDYKNDQKRITTTKSASANFRGGFFSPKKQDNVTFSGHEGGFWNKLGKKPWMQKFFKSKFFKNFLEKMDGLAVAEAYFVFAIATTIKPISIEMMPGSNKGDKDYNATKAVLAGVVDFALAQIALKPIEHKLEDFGYDIFGKKNKDGVVERLPNEKLVKEIQKRVPHLKDEKNFNNFKKIMGYAPKYGLAPIRSLLTIALIPPTLKLLFPKEAANLKSKKAAQNQVKHIEQTPQINKPNRQITQVTSAQKADKMALVGGVR